MSVSIMGVIEGGKLDVHVPSGDNSPVASLLDEDVLQRVEPVRADGHPEL